MIIQQVNEGSTAYLTVSFADKDGVPAAPASVTYRVDCLTTGQAVRAETPLTPGASVEITLSPSDNAIIQAVNRFERKVVTVKAVYGGSDAINSEYVYSVKNLQKV